MWEELAHVKGSLFSPPLKHRAFGGFRDFFIIIFFKFGNKNTLGLKVHQQLQL